ncbi:MAG: hypothetical protein WCF62_31705 [Pseudolabrys sp.]
MSARFLAPARLLARSKLEFKIPPCDVDDLAVERGGALAGSVEGFLECRDRGFERIRGAVIGLARLVHGALGKGSHALR